MLVQIQSIIDLSSKRSKEKHKAPIEVLGIVLQPKLQHIINTLPRLMKKKILQATRSARPRDVEKFIIQQIQENTGSVFDSGDTKICQPQHLTSASSPTRAGLQVRRGRVQEAASDGGAGTRDHPIEVGKISWGSPDRHAGSSRWNELTNQTRS